MHGRDDEPVERAGAGEAVSSRGGSRADAGDVGCARPKGGRAEAAEAGQGVAARIGHTALPLPRCEVHAVRRLLPSRRDGALSGCWTGTHQRHLPAGDWRSPIDSSVAGDSSSRCGADGTGLLRPGAPGEGVCPGWDGRRRGASAEALTVALSALCEMAGGGRGTASSPHRCEAGDRLLPVRDAADGLERGRR